MASNYALITGAALRTGREIALGLAHRGMNIVIHYNQSKEQADQLQKEIEQLGVEAIRIHADLSIESDIYQLGEQLSQQISGLQLLINNVGNYPRQRLLDSSYSEFQRLLQTNVQAPLAIIQTLDHLLVERSLIINMGCAGVEHNLANLQAPAYQLSKAALLNMTKVLALELASKKIRVNMISPGHLTNSIDLPNDIDELIPLGRAGTVDDILATIDYLLVDDNAVTGTNIDIGGGFRLYF